MSTSRGKCWVIDERIAMFSEERAIWKRRKRISKEVHCVGKSEGLARLGYWLPPHCRHCEERETRSPVCTLNTLRMVLGLPEKRAMMVKQSWRLISTIAWTQKEERLVRLGSE